MQYIFWYLAVSCGVSGGFQLHLEDSCNVLQYSDTNHYEDLQSVIPKIRLAVTKHRFYVVGL